MEAAPILALGLALIAAGASFFFALAETALFSLSPWQVRKLAEQFPRCGGVVGRLLGRPEDLLATMVLVNTLANAAILAVGLWMALSEQWPLGLTIAGLLLITLLGCEVLPKTLAVRQPELWSRRLAHPLAWLHQVARPFHQIAQRVNLAILRLLGPRTSPYQPALSDAEYQELIELAYQQGTLVAAERDIILQIISLDRRAAREVMRPRSAMDCISDDLTVEEMRAAARRLKHRRLPIHDEATDSIVGILNPRALLLDPQMDVADAIEIPSFVPETMNLLQLLQSLQRQRRGVAIVLDEFGGLAGLVTLEDILAEVVGKMRGETGASGFVVEKLGPGRWRVNAAMRLDDFRREYPALAEVEEVETLGGLLMCLLDVVPARGNSATFCGLKLTALVADERRVYELLVERIK